MVTATLRGAFGVLKCPLPNVCDDALMARGPAAAGKRQELALRLRAVRTRGARRPRGWSHRAVSPRRSLRRPSPATGAGRLALPVLRPAPRAWPWRRPTVHRPASVGCGAGGAGACGRLQRPVETSAGPGLGLAWREDLALRPDGRGRARCIRCKRPAPSAVTLRRHPSPRGTRANQGPLPHCARARIIGR